MGCRLEWRKQWTTQYASARWAWIPGLVFIVGRQLYAWEYVNNPASRLPGMTMTLLANGVLLVGGLIGVVLNII